MKRWHAVEVRAWAPAPEDSADRAAPASDRQTDRLDQAAAVPARPASADRVEPDLETLVDEPPVPAGLGVWARIPMRLRPCK
jgi:hypothetical protein